MIHGKTKVRKNQQNLFPNDIQKIWYTGYIYEIIDFFFASICLRRFAFLIDEHYLIPWSSSVNVFISGFLWVNQLRTGNKDDINDGNTSEYLLYGSSLRHITLTELQKDYTYAVVMKVITYTLVMFVIPFLTLIIVNCRIIIALRRSSNLRQQHTNTTPNAERNE